jgi:serine/threonine-protein kinase HipA
MSEDRELVVWMGPNPVGTLLDDRAGRLSFRYRPAYLAGPAPEPLSLSLPLRDDGFDDGESRPYFANVLPDGGLREAVARRLGISPRNDFALLAAVGGECAGAVSLLPPGVAPGVEGRYEPLDDAELDRLVGELPRRPLLAGERGIRLSLAGAQSKLPLRFADGRFFLARGGLATTHILKPAIPQLEDTVRNEGFCMALAGRAGLPVPRSWIHRGRDLAYVVERFDRRIDPDGTVARDHAEDFCQATGRLPERKYQAEGGPGFAECFALLQDHSAHPAPDRHALLRLVVLNALIHNADAHAKNLSLLHTGGAVRLAPFYDLLSTGVYEEVGEKMAMSIGGEKRPDALLRRHWERFADEVHVGRRLVLDTVGQMAAGLPALAAALAAEQAQAFGPSAIVTRIASGVTARSRVALQEIGRTEEG